MVLLKNNNNHLKIILDLQKSCKDGCKDEFSYILNQLPLKN